MGVISAGKYVPVVVVNDPGVSESGKYIGADLIIWEMQSVSLSTRLSNTDSSKHIPNTLLCQDILISKYTDKKKSKGPC